MSWARADDRYDDTSKIKRAWRLSGYAVGLHWMAVTASCRHESDGMIDPEWLAERLGVIPSKAAATALDTLVSLGLFELLPAGATQTVRDRSGNTITLGPISEDTYVVHDYLVYQDSSVTLAGRRADERLRKAVSARAKEIGLSVVEYRKTPGFLEDFPPDSERKTGGIQAASGDPDPTRPDPTRPIPPLAPPADAGGGPGSRVVASLPRNSRALATNPRAVNEQRAATAATRRATTAIGALAEPSVQHRTDVERLQPALVAAVGEQFVLAAHLEALSLVGVDGDVLVLDGPDDDWVWVRHRFSRAFASVCVTLGVQARLASADEHAGLQGTGAAA